jgi:hypothetical protein
MLQKFTDLIHLFRDYSAPFQGSAMIFIETAAEETLQLLVKTPSKYVD